MPVTYRHTANLVNKRWIQHQDSAELGATNAYFDPILQQLQQRLSRDARAPAIRAIIFYGSHLRGQTDSLLDAYLIVERLSQLNTPRWHSWLGTLLAPNVYQCEVLDAQGHKLRMKYAVVTLKQFRRQNEQAFHSYFWARFAQPTLVIGTSPELQTQLAQTCAVAAARMAQQTLPLLSNPFGADVLWQQALAQTYRCELRAEAGDRNVALVSAQLDYYQALTQSLVADGLDCQSPSEGVYQHKLDESDQIRSRRTWQIRAWHGKCLSVLRLMKAAFTFNDGLDYLLWKIERHSGIRATATERQRRYPLLFAWPLVWELYRQGAFR